MTQVQELFLPSTGTHRLHLCLWEPDCPPKGILQISHGMCEYILRYDHFARWLAQQGWVVAGSDHLGHGATASSPEDLGHFQPQDPSRQVVEDLYTVSRWLREKYPQLPLFLMGHSMGSFLARRYAMTYGDSLAGLIIMGTGSQPSFLVYSGLFLTKLIGLFRGQRYRSPLLYSMTLGSYNRAFAPNRTSCDWLSKNTENVDQYLKDPLCQFRFTVNGYHTLLSTLAFIQSPKNIARLPRELPIFLVAGDQDPVGNMGKGVLQVYQLYRTRCSQVECKLYPGLRHEILNETERMEVYQDILTWLENHLKG